MAKLQCITRTNGSKVYSINIPLELVDELGAKKSDIFIAKIKNKELVFTREIH